MPYKNIPETSWSIREAEGDELPFIYATWLNSYRSDSWVGKSVRKGLFFHEYPIILDALLQKSKVLIAYFPDTPSVILSYLVYEPEVLHYVFTKEVYQKNGIAMSLFLTAFENLLSQGTLIHFSHRTFMSEAILQKYQENLNYNPFKLYETFKPKGEIHA